MADEQEKKNIWTPLKIIQWAVPFLSQKGIPNARFDVEVLIAFALRIDRLKVYLQFDRPLDLEELALIRDVLKRRASFEPIQYITGQREFFGLNFKVSPGVLIPRPETEILVERAIQFLKSIPEEKRFILDLGTGSGCIAISLAKALPCKVWAVDISDKALEIARENEKSLGVENIQWRLGSWFSALIKGDPEQFQVIVSNPPYISLLEKDELSPEIKAFEPPEALFAGESGLLAYEEISKCLNERLVKGGMALFELSAKNNDKISSIFRGQNLVETKHLDLQGLPRVIQLEK